MAGWLPLAIASTATTTWNQADRNGSITLSGGNLTATSSAGASFVSVRTIANASAGKKYWEITINAATGTNVVVLGIANSTASLSNFVGSDLNGVGWAGNGPVYINSANTGSIQTWAVGDVLGFAFDLGNKKIWFRDGSGNWNNDVLANQNPATNTGGISTATLNAGPYFPMITFDNVSDAATANFGGSAFANAAPSGFGNW